MESHLNYFFRGVDQFCLVYFADNPYAGTWLGLLRINIIQLTVSCLKLFSIVSPHSSKTTC